MLRIAFQTCLTVMALLISASASVAAECADDPNECTPKNLCEIATALYGGNTSWSAAASKAKHVTLAQGLGMSCGVLAALDPCDSDPNECKVSQLCEKATTESAGQVSWNDSAEVYVALAKEYGLSCEVVVEETVVEEKTCSAKTLEVCSTSALCQSAAKVRGGSKIWTKTSAAQVYVLEAKKRGLSCGVVERNASGELPKCVRGVFHNCFGTYTWSDGSKYVGEWKDDKRNGRGTNTYADGNKYVGEFKDGKLNGQGTYIYADGNKYVGKFKDGKIGGQGTLTLPDGNKYVGVFKDGKINGQGTHTLPDGTIHQGIWKNNKLISQTANLFGRNDFNALNSTRRKQLQYGLKKLGYYTSTVDGKYGPNTQRAVRGYAKARGITSGYPNSVFNQIVSDFNVPAPSTNQASRKKSPSFFELLGAFAEGYNAVGQGYQGSNQSGSQSSNIGLRLKDSYRSGGNTMCRYNDGSVYNIGLGICPLTK